MSGEANDGVDTPGALLAVPFQDDILWAADDQGKIWVAARPVIENLGLAWPPQYKALLEDEVLSVSVTLKVTETPAGPRETLCLPLEMIHGWLFTIKAKRAKPEIRAKLTAYRRECYKVLWEYFHGSSPDLVHGQGLSLVDTHTGIEAHLHQHQLRVLAAVKAYGHGPMSELIGATGLSKASVSRAIFLLWYLGVIETYADQGMTRCRVVPVEQRPALIRKRT